MMPFDFSAWYQCVIVCASLLMILNDDTERRAAVMIGAVWFTLCIAAQDITGSLTPAFVGIFISILLCYGVLSILRASGARWLMGLHNILIVSALSDLCFWFISRMSGEIPGWFRSYQDFGALLFICFFAWIWLNDKKLRYDDFTIFKHS